MSTKKEIKSPSKVVVDLIKKEIKNKKERHKGFIKSINPVTIRELQKMKKIGTYK